jgi:purine-nucleoside phosphorylase
MILEHLAVLGVQNILFFGWCGSLQEDLVLGNLLVPDRALSEEGTSAHYATRNHHPMPSAHVLKTIEDSLLTASIPFRRGTVWSTDAPYRETREKVLLYQEQGVLGVEMELSALFTVASFRQVNIGALLVVSDELGTLRWKAGFARPELNKARKVAAGAIPIICERMTN